VNIRHRVAAVCVHGRVCSVPPCRCQIPYDNNYCSKDVDYKADTQPALSSAEYLRMLGLLGSKNDFGRLTREVVRREAEDRIKWAY